MKVYATIQLEEGETTDKTALELTAEVLAAVGGDPATDTCQVTVTATSTTEPAR